MTKKTAGGTEGVDWIIFGDDWGGHPSTTQHLALHLPPEDRVIWVDSIGMRSPGLSLVDLRRLIAKASGFFQTGTGGSLYEGTVGALARVRPKVLPWHQNRLAARINGLSLARSITRAATRSGMEVESAVFLASYPAVVGYADVLPCDKLVYLRLDEYSLYPGVNPKLVEATEEAMFDRADLVLATARALLPSDPHAHKGRYLPQGVHCEHFETVPLSPPSSKVLGFFGTVANWLDFDLIEGVAKRAEGWTLEFLGQVDTLPGRIARLPNVAFRRPVPFGELPAAISHWSAAWIPFQLNTLTEAVNPLKIREYLAAGLPSHCTPLPEVSDLGDHVLCTHDLEAIVGWLKEVASSDSPSARAERRRSVRGESWKARATELRRLVTEA